MASKSQTLTKIKLDYNEEALKQSEAGKTIRIIYDNRYESQDGSSWRSDTKFKYGTFSAGIKCPSGNTSGLVSAFYLTSEEMEDRKNRPRIHDEIDFEFVGNNHHKQVETDYYVNGKRQKAQIDELGFDSSSEFHEYSISWQRDKIEWFIDGKSIRKAKKSEGNLIPEKPMYVCGSFWNGTKKHSDWTGIYEGTDQPYTLVMKDIQVPKL